MSSKPVFVLVPGAWHSASTWDPVITRLQERDYTSHAVSLPSTAGDPNASLLDDIQAVQATVAAQTDAGRDVVLVVHSYGGFVGESALAHLPTAQKPSFANGKVVALTMMGTGFTRAGLAFLDGSGGQPPPFWRANTDTGFAELVGDPTPLFYHDLSVEEAKKWTAKLLPQSLKCLAEGGEHVHEGWRDVPVWYLITAEDRGLPVEAQRWMAGDAREKGAVITVREVQSGHCPMLSRPKDTVEFLVEAAKAAEC